jgi:glycosyltransferase involved in cell wall biosynthesis
LRKIIHVEDFFHPEAGYQVNVLSKFQVKYGWDVTIITSKIESCPKHLKYFFGTDNIEQKDLKFTADFGVKIIRVPIITFYSGRAIYSFRIFNIIKKLKPLILFIHGNESYIGLMYTLRLRRLDFPVIFDNHMLEMATKNPLNKQFRLLYRKIFSPLIVKNNAKVIKVVDDNYVNTFLGLPYDNTPFIPFGSDTLNFKKNNLLRTEIRLKYHICANDFVVIYAGKLDETKGSLLLARAIKDKIILTNNNKKIVFFIVGKTYGNYGKKVSTLFNNSNNTIIRLDTLSYYDLSKYYNASDLAIFPKQVSLSFFDVQTIGLPVLLENNSINRNRIKGNGMLFEPDNYKDLREKITIFANMNSEEYSRYSNMSMHYIQNNELTYDKIIFKYESIINATISNFYRKNSKILK